MHQERRVEQEHSNCKGSRLRSCLALMERMQAPQQMARTEARPAGTSLSRAHRQDSAEAKTRLIAANSPERRGKTRARASRQQRRRPKMAREAQKTRQSSQELAKTRMVRKVAPNMRPSKSAKESLNRDRRSSRPLRDKRISLRRISRKMVAKLE